MKKILYTTIATIMLFSAPTIYAQHSTDTPANKSAKGYTLPRKIKGWQLVWADEFKGKRLDSNSWQRCPRIGADWARHMSPLDELVRVEDGLLKLYGIIRPKDVEDDVPYLTGGVQSIGLRSQQLGRFDIRARFDCGQGFWPAIWLMPDKDIHWPNGGEIDIMEHLNSDSIAYQTVHTRHTHDNREPKTVNGSNSPIDPTVFNIYSVVIKEDAIIFYINGKQTFTYHRLTPTVAEQFPFADHPFYVILSAQLGGSWVGEINPNDLPVEMDVDYVRFYKPSKN